MKLDENGCSTCQLGKEQHKSFAHRGKTYFQYDYRTESGDLFSCVKPTLEECREKRDEWLKKNQSKIG